MAPLTPEQRKAFKAERQRRRRRAAVQKREDNKIAHTPKYAFSIVQHQPIRPNNQHTYSQSEEFNPKATWKSSIRPDWTAEDKEAEERSFFQNMEIIHRERRQFQLVQEKLQREKIEQQEAAEREEKLRYERRVQDEFICQWVRKDYQEKLKAELRKKQSIRDCELLEDFKRKKAEEINLRKSKVEREERHKQGKKYDGNVKNEDLDCRRHINQCKEEIRLAHISMKEMRGKVKLLQDFRLEKKRQKEMLLNQLEAMKELARIKKEKLADLSLKKSELKIIRISVKDTLERHFMSELELRTLQCEDLESRIAALDSLESNNKNVDEFIESKNQRLKCLEETFKGIEKELKYIKEKEMVIARDVEQVKKSLIGLGPSSNNQVLHNLQLELKGIESDIKASLENNTEELFNQLVISTEEKVRKKFQLKNTFDIKFT